jgi:hypothetical protein
VQFDATRLPAPSPNDHPDLDLWLDEQIWGHRIWDSQSPWLIFLEFLNIAESCMRSGVLLDEKGKYYPLTYRPYKRLYLRNILFNNQFLSQIADKRLDSSSSWSEWIPWMNDKAQGVIERDFSYLKARFHSFADFSSLVNMLRGSAVESESNRRWSSRFVFPFGPNAFYEDLNILPSGSASREYINFGRTGELVYLMLCRSKAATELRPHLAALMAGDNHWNRLLGLFQPDDVEEFSSRGKSYLPYSSHPVFDLLGEDWLAIFRLQVPGFDCMPHLVTLGALHTMLYQLTLAASGKQSSAKVTFICEVVAPKKTLVRELSSLSYQENNLLPSGALEQYIAAIEQSPEWMAAANDAGAFAKCRQLLSDRLRWGDDYEGPGDPGALLKELRSEALRRHKQHVANVHRNYGRDVGLVSKRATNKLRYAPSDALIKTLLFANVEQRMELNDFLALLFARYGLIFGEREAEQVLPRDDFDKKSFQANARRLEQRLGSLGMLRRLSDGCAYVENPYGRGPA